MGAFSFQSFIVGKMQEQKSVAKELSDEKTLVRRMGREGGLLCHLQQAGNNSILEPLPTMKKTTASISNSAESTEQARSSLPTIPIRRSAHPQPLNNRQPRSNSPTRSTKDDAQANFNISTTRIVFLDKCHQPTLHCTFSEASDIRRLFARARVAKIATQATHFYWRRW